MAVGQRDSGKIGGVQDGLHVGVPKHTPIGLNTQNPFALFVH
jgi:hypothetical protein